MKNFWDRNAKIYNLFMKKDRDMYEKLYSLIRPAVKNKTVLELAAGTGLISKNIAAGTQTVEATDISCEMIKEAEKYNSSEKIHFSVRDMFNLPYKDGSFDVVIAANALHIVPVPEKALCEIRRVLKDDGVFIAPTFTHKNNSVSGSIRVFFMRLAGFPLHSRWASGEYIDFLAQNGWQVRKTAVLKASFPLTYAECMKKT